MKYRYQTRIIESESERISEDESSISFDSTIARINNTEEDF